MELKNKKIGYCFTGSFCTFEASITQMERLIKEEKAIIFPIMSYNSYNLDTKFGTAKYFKDKIERITGNPIIHTIQEAEPIGPKDLLDILIVAPCSRKYDCKSCKFDKRLSSNNGNKINFAKREARSYSCFDK